VQRIIEELKKLGVKRVAPTHCTGDPAIASFKEAFGGGYIKTGVGLVLEVPVE
jgi:7,8-dihydropterin-6-yl-methyl-4-(beta-D-ribofuranosyl)aminobenzene 5'-phosphate synthase